MFGKIARHAQVKDDNYDGSGQMEVALWEVVETSFNEVCMSISITKRMGTISTELDDDKMWLRQS